MDMKITTIKKDNFFFPSPICAIVPGGTFVSMNRFSTLCGWLAQQQER
jgi:hypothetical protein